MNTLLCQLIEEQAAKLTQDDVVALGTRLPALRERFAKLDRLDYPDLHAQYDLLAALIEDCGENLRCNLPETCLREVAFALLYLEGHGDLLPDDMPHVGLIDDQVIVQLVLYKHRDCLLASPRGHLHHWNNPPMDFDEAVVERLHQRLEWMRQDGMAWSTRTDDQSSGH